MVKIKKLLLAICTLVMGVCASFAVVACEEELKTFDYAKFEDATYLYDGLEKNITVSGTPRTATIVYSPDNAYTDVGEYEITATITADGYETLALTATLTIEYSEQYLLKTQVESLIADLQTAVLANKTDAENKITALKAEYQAEIDELEESVTANGSAITALQTAYTAKVKELEDTAKANKIALETALDTAKTELQGKITALETEYEEEVADLEQKAKSDKEELEAQISALNGLINATNENLTALQTAYNAKVEELAKADEDNKKALQAEISNLNDEIVSTNENLTALQNAHKEKVEALQAVDMQLQTDLTALATELATAKTNFNDEIDRVEAGYRTEIETLETELTQAINTAKTETDGKIATLQTAIDSANEAITENKAELENKITALETATNTKVKEIESLIATVQATDTTQNEKIADLLERVIELEKGMIITGIEFAENGDLVITFADGTTQMVKAPEKHVHTFGDWTNFSTDTTSCEDRLLYHICGSCSVIEWRHGVYDDHIWNDSGVCADCGQTIGVNYAVSEDGSYAEVVGYTGTETNVRIAESYKGLPVQTISEEAFAGNTTIVSVTIPYTVTTIGASAFQNCTSLQEIIFAPTPDGEKEVPLEFVGGSNANLFSGSKIVEFTFPERTNKIGRALFSSNKTITKVTFPTDVETLDGASMFSGASALTEVVFPETGMTEVYSLMFSNCTSLTTMNHLPDTVTKINGYAFSGCAKLSEITIPANCTVCDYNSFNNCNALSVIRFADNSKFPEDGFGSCFSSTMKIKKIENIPAIWTKLPNTWGLALGVFKLSAMPLERITFAEGSMLQEIEADVFRKATFTSFTFPETYVLNENGQKVRGSLVLGANIFNGNKKVTSVKLSSSVSSVSGTFNDSALTSITIDPNNPYLALHETMPIFTNVVKDGNGNVLAPDTYFGAWKALDLTSTEGVLTIPEGIKTISANAFEEQTDIAKVVLPKTLETLGASAFAGTAITSIAIPESVTDFGTGMFTNCTILTSATLPANLEKIPEQTFKNCTALESYTLGSLVKEIEKNAFEGSGITSITWNSSLTTIGNSAFKNCDSLITLSIPSSVTSIGTGLFENCDVLVGVTFPSTLETLPKNTFKGCKGLTSFTVPTNMTEIGESAFENSAVATVKWNKALATLGVDAFKATALTKLNDMPASVNTIGCGAFMNCLSLTEVTIPTGVTALYGTNIGNMDGQFKGCSVLEKVTFHDNFTHISGGVFYKTTSLRSIDLPDSLTVLGHEVFGYSGLESITIPEKVTEIGSKVMGPPLTGVGSGSNGATFSNCTNLKTVIYEGTITKIWNHSFYKTAVSDFDALVPDTVTEVQSWAFAYTPITSATLKAGVTYGTSLFSNCTSLTNVTIEAGVTTLQGYMFEKCTALKRVDIPAALEKIPNSLFSGCENLYEIKIPSTVTSIGMNAFKNCGNLEYVYYEGTAEVWEKIAIGNYNTDLTSATRYYYSETEPALNADETAYDGNYWRYVDGVATPWVYKKVEE